LRRRAFIALAALLAGLALGSLQAHRAERFVLPGGNLADSARLICDARALSDPVRRERSASFDASLIACRFPQEMEMQRASGNVRMYSSPEMPRIGVGDLVRFQAKFRRPRDFRNGGGFSWRRFLLARGIGATGALSGPEWIAVLPSPSGGMVKQLHVLRSGLDSAIASSVEGRAGGVIRAIVGGRKEAVDERVRSSFGKAGIAHLLAISGLHVGYVSLFIYLAMWLILGRWSRLILSVPLKKVAAGFSLPLVWGFILLVGAPVSAVRAGIMVSVYIMGLMLSRRQDLLTTLAIAAAIIVVIEPLAILDVSFQLSFVSVLAIVVMVPRMMSRIEPWFVHRRGFCWRALYRVCQLAAVTIAATVGSLPLVAYHFNIVTGAGIVANLIAVPWMGCVLLPLAALASVMTFMWPAAAANALWPLAGWAAKILIGWADSVSGVTSPLVVEAAPGALEVAFVYAAILLLVFWRRIPYRRVAAVLLAAGLIFDFAWWHVRPMMSDVLEVTFLDVGMGDSALVRFPGGRTMIVDGGGLPRSSFDVGEHVVVPALLSRGVRRVDWMVLSHPHHDHYRGLAAVAEHFDPQALWMTDAAPPEAEREFWDEFMGRIDGAGVDVRVVDGSMEPIDVEGVRMEMMYPRGDLPTDLDANDASIVFKLTYGDVSFLFTGDLMEWGEESIVRSGADIEATVLKVGHHGSETSSGRKFLEAVHPGIAVMSVGQDNPYGMPDRVVLDRLDDIGATVYRTDHHGAVTIRTDGHGMDVSTVTKALPRR
jgi:competence protein ComEC